MIFSSLLWYTLVPSGEIFKNTSSWVWPPGTLIKLLWVESQVDLKYWHIFHLSPPPKVLTFLKYLDGYECGATRQWVYISKKKKLWKMNSAYAKLNIHISHGSAIPFLDTWPTKRLHVFHQNIQKVIFMTALFAIAKNWGQLICPSK